MQRECLKYLSKWKNNARRKPLILMGARQVGKTWLMEEFARKEFPDDFVIVNFMRRQALSQQLQHSDIDPASLLKLLQTATGKRIIPGKTLLILDEIQECPSALTSLKFFYEDLPELAVMAAGSLLGLSYGKNKSAAKSDDEDKGSFPVGKVDRLNVYPLTFSEFLVASGRESMVSAIEEGDWKTVGLLADDYGRELKNYLVVGGMPEAVVDWLETGALAVAREAQLRILADYDDDFKKHAPIELLPKIRLVWNNISAQLAKENKKFVYSALKSGARAREYESALEWLCDAGMVYRHYRVCPPRLPISHYMDFGAFKLFLHDVGLLGAMSLLDPAVVLEKNELFTNFKGAMTEQFVLQELVARGVESGYWTPDEGTAEVDFVLQGRDCVWPLEAKSATNTKAKSLGVYIDEYRPQFAIKTSLKNFSDSGMVHSLPLYALGQRIKKEIDGQTISNTKLQLLTPDPRPPTPNP